jgi:predicted dehydrogenase
MAGLRIAVIGAGSIGRRHAENAASLGADVALLSWREIESTGGPDAMIARLRPQAAVIATATDLRTPVIAPFAEAGIPLYIEKPLAAAPGEVEAIATLMAPVADRSMLGFMMRYHRGYAFLAALDRTDIYRARFEIGHDVRQWRANWRFADSYAARPEGGGVLLDLCHEIDLCLSLFPDLAVRSVDCIGHRDFPGVDFATTLRLSGGGAVADVAMDYLSPVSLRRLQLRGTAQAVDLDLGTGAGRHWIGGEWHDISLPVQRNQMFLDAMDDFLALVDGRAPMSGAANPPLFTHTLPIARAIAAAHAARRFVGMTDGDFA